MKTRSAYKRDEVRGIKRVVVRLEKPELDAIEKARARQGYMKPSVSALIRRGIKLACAELNKLPRR